MHRFVIHLVKKKPQKKTGNSIKCPTLKWAHIGHVFHNCPFVLKPSYKFVSRQRIAYVFFQVFWDISKRTFKNLKTTAARR